MMSIFKSIGKGRNSFTDAFKMCNKSIEFCGGCYYFLKKIPCIL